jgi:hypothetical protein
VIRRADVATRRSGFIFALVRAGDPVVRGSPAARRRARGDGTADFPLAVIAHALDTPYTEALFYFTLLGST